MAGTIETTRAREPVKVKDVSSRGVLIEYGKALPQGGLVTFGRAGFEADARVAWCAGGLIGLEFTFRQNDDDFFLKPGRVADPGWVAPKCTGRSAISSSRLTQREQDLARLWAANEGITLPESPIATSRKSTK